MKRLNSSGTKVTDRSPRVQFIKNKKWITLRVGQSIVYIEDVTAGK